MHKISKYTRSGGTVISDIIFIENPFQKSLAAAVLLRNELMLQDIDFLSKDDLETWLIFREDYLNEILLEKGDLICAYCGKPHLEIGGRTHKDLILNNKNPLLATVDHIIPLAKNGEKYNKKNLCVSCKKCNKEKGTLSLEEFKIKKQKQ